MWEVFKGGVTPYADVQPYDLKDYLRSGRRLEKPERCSHKLYGVLRIKIIPIIKIGSVASVSTANLDFNKQFCILFCFC